MNSEIRHYVEMIEDLRAQVTAIIQDLPGDALNWRPIEGREDHATNSLAIMAAHVAGAEHFWITEIVGRVPSTRQRDLEFLTHEEGPQSLVAKLDMTGAETRAVMGSLTAGDLDGTRQVRDREVTVRWAILHVIDHTALHLGHMQLTHQLWMGGRSQEGPRWFQRVPPAS